MRQSRKEASCRLKAAFREQLTDQPRFTSGFAS